MVRDDKVAATPAKDVVESTDARMKKLMDSKRTQAPIKPGASALPDETPPPDDAGLPTEITAEEGKSLDELAAKVSSKKETTTSKKVISPISKDDEATPELESKDETTVVVKKGDSKNQKTENDQATVEKEALSDDDDTNNEPNAEDDEIKLDEEDVPSPLANEPETTDEKDSDDQTSLGSDEKSKQPDDDVDVEANNDNDSLGDDTKSDTPTSNDDAKLDTGQESGIVDAVANQAATAKQKTKDDKEQDAYNAKVDKLIESKEYVVPIGHLRRRRNAQIILLVVLLVAVLGLAVLNFALDGEYLSLEIPYLPVTNVL